MSNLFKQSKKLPDAPGVYFFKKGAKTLYIGKATSLRDRVQSYFRADLSATRGPLVSKVIGRADNLDFKETGSVLEALLLEAELIKKIKPPGNSDGKDDKSANCVVITDEEYPKIILIRKREIEKGDSGIKLKHTFGPYPSGGELKAALKIIRRLFPWRDEKCGPNGSLRNPTGRPCFNHQIGLCPGTCTGEISKKEYGDTIKKIALILSGKISALSKILETEMKARASKREFEKAGEIKRQLFGLKHIQDVSLIKKNSEPPAAAAGGKSSRQFRIEAFDIAHFSGEAMAGAMIVLEGGVPNKTEYRKFRIRTVNHPNDPAALREILVRRFHHKEWTLPDLIVVDGNEIQRRAALDALRGAGKKISVVSVVKDEHHKPRAIFGEKGISALRNDEILLANAEAHRFCIAYHRRRLSTRRFS